MRFDQMRREYKKTLWGEELDNEKHVSPLAPKINLDFMHQYTGKKYQCLQCKNQYEENETVLTKHGIICINCYSPLADSNEEGGARM